MGAIVVRGNKKHGQKEKNTPQANWLRIAVSEPTHANKATKWLGLLLAMGGAR